MERVRHAFLNDADVKAIQDLNLEFYFLFKPAIIELIKKKAIYVYEIDEQIVGILITSFSKKKHEHKVQSIVVNDAYRGKQIGRKLFDEFIAEQRPIMIKILAISGESKGKKFDSIPFWQKMGFKETGHSETSKRGFILTEMVWLSKAAQSSL